MTAQSVYSSRSCSTITSLNKIVISTSCDDMWKGGALLASYAIKNNLARIIWRQSRVAFELNQVQILYQEPLTTLIWKTSSQL